MGFCKEPRLWQAQDKAPVRQELLAVWARLRSCCETLSRVISLFSFVWDATAAASFAPLFLLVCRPDQTRGLSFFPVQQAEAHDTTPPIPAGVLGLYIAYCRYRCAPRLTREARDNLRDEYLRMRHRDQTSKWVLTSPGVVALRVLSWSQRRDESSFAS